MFVWSAPMENNHEDENIEEWNIAAVLRPNKMEKKYLTEKICREVLWSKWIRNMNGNYDVQIIKMEWFEKRCFNLLECLSGVLYGTSLSSRFW